MYSSKTPSLDHQHKVFGSYNNSFYNPGAPNDKCIMFAVEDVKKKLSACQEFFLMEVETRVVAATLKVLGLDSIDGEPNNTSIPPSLVDSSTDSKKAFLKSLSLNVIDKYVLHQEQMDKIIADAEQEKQADVGILPDGKFPCRFSGCKKTFPREKTHGLKGAEAISTLAQCSDDMFNYQLALLEYGMLYKNFL